MKLLFAPLFSGSSGNCTYVGTEDEGVIIDCGVSATAALEQLKLAGLNPAAVKAILVTHEHTDHINGIGPLARKLNAPVYATAGTWEGMGRRVGKLNESFRRVINTGFDFFDGGMCISAFDTPHDCLEPCGYTLSAHGISVALATDIGYIRPSWLEAVKGSDLVLLEADYDKDMLLAGGYPFELKKRILGKKGHLSNEDAGAAAVALTESGARRVILGHLSQNNNFPELARKTCENILYEEGIRAGRDVMLDVARRDGLTGVYTVYAGA